MSKKSKAGRGALVRRLRREYGISEADARHAAEADNWPMMGLVHRPKEGPCLTNAVAIGNVRTADEAARYVVARKRLTLCPQVPMVGWCYTSRTAEIARRRGARSAALLCAIASLGMS